MTFDEYQNDVWKHAKYPSLGMNPAYPALGMGGECGEVQDKIKKVLRDKNGEFSPEIKLELAKEIGDVLWYAAALASELGYKFGDIAQMNLDKSRSRRERNKICGEGDNR